MGKNQSASGLTNIIQYDNNGNVSFVSGSTTLMQISSSGAITTTGVISGSNALSASYALNSGLLNGTGSVGFATTGSLLTVSSSQQQISASQQQLSSSFLILTASFNAVSASQQQISASYIALSASYNTFSGSASTRITENSSSIQQISSSQQQISASLLNVISIFATTGSNSFRATQSITGSLTVTGQIIAQTLNVQQVTSSIIYSSGSNNFGCDLNSRQTFTGSMFVTGAANFSNCVIIGGALSGTSATFSSSVNIGTAGSEKLNIFGSGSQFINVKNTTSAADMFVGMSSALAAAFIGTGGTDPIVFSTAGTERMRITSTGIACFSCQICAGAGMVANTLTISCNSGDDRAMYMSLNCSANYNSGAANTIARSVNSLKFLWYNNCWEIGATRGDDTAIQALVFARQGNTYLAMTCHGISCFACQVCAPNFVASSEMCVTSNTFTKAGPNSAIVTLSKTTTSGCTCAFNMGVNGYSPGVGDNVSGLVIVTVNQTNSNIQLNSGIYIGVVNNPRGANACLIEISRNLGSSNLALRVVQGTGNNDIEVCACSASGITTPLRYTLTFIGGGGLS